jgi:hypothetical protein
MKFPRAYRVLPLLLAAAVPSSAKAPDPARSWLVLSKITHRRDYTIETRDRKCVWGTVTRITSDSLTAKVRGPNFFTGTVTFPRADVFRVDSDWHVYYSGRSSWADVSSLRGEGKKNVTRSGKVFVSKPPFNYSAGETIRERLKIVTKTGKTYELKPPFKVSDDGILFTASEESTKIPKNEIAQVYDLVPKPLTDGGEYAAHELGPMLIFDPDLYVYGLHLEQYVPVLLYDASKPEDNSPAQCEMKR